MAEFIDLAQLLLIGRAAEQPVALAADGVLGFAAFAAEVARWRSAFAAQAGQRFALFFDDSARFAAALFGAWHAGKCAYLPADVLPATLARLRGEVDGFAGEVPGEPTVTPAANADAALWAPLDPAAVALVVYTSGSTGEPGAIPKRLGQLDAEVAALERCFGPRLADATVLASVSHQHIYGLLFRVLWPLAAGRRFAAGRLAFPEDIAAVLAASGPCALVASPAHLKRLPAQLPWAAGRASLRALFSSGGPLPDEALPDCRALLGRAPIEVYGSSETGGVAWRQRSDDAALAWRPLPGVAVRVAEGVLEVRSPHLPDAGWQPTADRAEARGEGFVLLGRADRIVKIEEKRVSLDALEQALRATGLVDEARVLALPGARTLLAVAAVPSEAGWALHDGDGRRALSQRLRTALASVAEAAVLPRRWRYLWALPANSQGKTTVAALLALFDPRRPIARLRAHGPAAATLELEVAPASPYFDGHFAVAPILPGVAQLDWAIRLGRELFALPPHFLRMEAVKFQQVIVPGTVVTLELTLKSPSAAERVLGFKLGSAAGAHASGRIVFGDAP